MVVMCRQTALYKERGKHRSLSLSLLVVSDGQPGGCAPLVGPRGLVCVLSEGG